MVYILHQRLNAQKVAKDKENKVLREVIAAMHEKFFIVELFNEQEVYDIDSVKQIFNKLAHSSLMRLNASSMGKLFDLMIMGFKQQIMRCVSPWDLLHMTLIHIHCMRNLIMRSTEPDHPQALITLESLSFVEEKLSENFRFDGPFGNLASMVSLKATIHNFVLAKKIKASLFLQLRQQTQTGDFVINNDGALPVGTDMPGSIKVYKNKRPYRVYETRTRMTSFSRSKNATASSLWDADFTMGSNVYSINNSKFCSEDASKDDEEARKVLDRLEELIVVAGGGIVGRGIAGSPSKPASLTPLAARAEAKLTQSLLGGTSKGEKGSGNDSFTLPRLRLMTVLDENSEGYMNNDDVAATQGRKGTDHDTGNEELIQVFIEEIDATADAKTMESMLENLNFKDAGKVDAKADAKSGADDDSDDDLLALMDSVK